MFRLRILLASFLAMPTTVQQLRMEVQELRETLADLMHQLAAMTVPSENAPCTPQTAARIENVLLPSPTSTPRSNLSDEEATDIAIVIRGNPHMGMN